MYLKSLTLKGFKSFADPTTLDLEPGVTVVVGPNGSGKSNVVDAVAWVLGAQGPRVVRSAKMDDVIFAGTAKRAALGRAEVSLTIDNASRRLPIDFNEVTITRTLFRTGESEYQINGVTCRLLDVQELLSDTGVGRQQHVIVGQGQLDAVLAARPEDRRAIIEEAAGVLKYRRRRERSERRLEASEAALERLQDLLREVRRQLKPLERQASSAMRHEEIAHEAAALRLFLAGQELSEFDRRLRAIRDEKETIDAQIATMFTELSSLDALLSAGQDEIAAARTEDLTPLVGRLNQLVERAQGLAALVAERRRARAELASLREDADAILALEAELASTASNLTQTDANAALLAPDWDFLATAESELASAQAAHVERFGVVEAIEPNTTMHAARTQLERARSELANLREHQVRANERVVALEEQRDEQSRLRADLERTVADLRARREDAARLRNETANAEGSAQSSLVAARDALHAAEIAERQAFTRLETLDGAIANVEPLSEDRFSAIEGVIGSLQEIVSVSGGAELAFEAALEGALHGIVTRDATAARRVVQALRAGEEASVLVATHGVTGHGVLADAPVGTELLRRFVSSSTPAVEALLDRLIGDVVLANGEASAAIEVALSQPDRVVVTPGGDRFSARGWRLGAAASGIARRARDEARSQHHALQEKIGATRRALEEATQLFNQASAAALAASRADDAVESALSQARSQFEIVNTRRDRLVDALAPATIDRDNTLRKAEEALVRVGELSDELTTLESDDASRFAQSVEANTARRLLDEAAQELGARRRDLEVRAASLDQRRALLVERTADLERRLSERTAAREIAAARRGTYARDEAVLSGLARALEGITQRATAASTGFADEAARRTILTRERLERIGSIRRDREDLERRVSAMRERHQRLEIDETEARVRYEAAIERVERDLEAIPEEAKAAVQPELPEGVDAPTRLRELERELRLLGPVNPLAREELVALRERNEFLESQLEDVRSAWRELNQVIHAIDAEIVSVFSSAFTDVMGHFANLIETLFPGGSGALTLTSPDDLLQTGVEIEARPAGRNVRRLSLLSGGERSLVAVAFLFAVFRSRPSPFYLLDEVEAALDEVNLLRFLDLVESFRDEAQLVIVSHQKKTMEVADALYGISMQPGGASKAVSETLARHRLHPPIAAVSGLETP